jgi:hypothetical protein
MESNKDNNIKTLKSKRAKKENLVIDTSQTKRDINSNDAKVDIKVDIKVGEKVDENNGNQDNTDNTDNTDNDKKKINAKKIYKCDECNFTAITPSNFLKHLTSEKHKRHGEKKVNKCELCEYVSNSIYNYNVHKVTQHGTTEEKKTKCPFYCDICDVGFFSKIFHDKHINSKNHSNLKLIKEIQQKEESNKKKIN